MDDGQYKEDIQSYERSVLSQWRELKDILKQTIASISKGNTSSMIPTRTNKTSSNSAADEESSKQEGEQVTLFLFAMTIDSLCIGHMGCFDSLDIIFSLEACSCRVRRYDNANIIRPQAKMGRHGETRREFTE